jgi:hypothetical protein
MLVCPFCDEATFLVALAEGEHRWSDDAARLMIVDRMEELIEERAYCAKLIDFEEAYQVHCVMNDIEYVADEDARDRCNATGNLVVFYLTGGGRLKPEDVVLDKLYFKEGEDKLLGPGEISG